jgi:hypothetical protein
MEVVVVVVVSFLRYALDRMLGDTTRIKPSRVILITTSSSNDDDDDNNNNNNRPCHDAGG